MKKFIKKLAENLGLIRGVVVTIGAICIASVLSKNLGEFLDREDF